MSASVVHEASGSSGRLRNIFGRLLKYLAAVLLCLTPVTAVLVLGWLSRKMAHDVGQRLDGKRPGSWPNFVKRDDVIGPAQRPRRIGALIANLKAGLKTWIAVLSITLPFSLVWFAGWFAGWENSFSKGYELSGVWPLVSLAAIALSLPVLTLLPMAIAHQAVIGSVTAIFEFRRIAALAVAAGWTYIALSLLIGIGSIGVLGARGLPVFAEEFSARVAAGSVSAIGEFAQQYKLVMTAFLVAGLLVMRNVMARVYAGAQRRQAGGRPFSIIKAGVIFSIVGLIWAGIVFLIYVAQFLNYAWWSWVNQPFTMLPWIGII